MAERKARDFTRSMNSRGMAAVLRESVSQVVRESSVQNKHTLVDPIDFEGFVYKNKTLIQNDPQREMLMYPNDDVSEIILPKTFRTINSEIPHFSSKKSNGVQSPVKVDSPTNGSSNGSSNGSNGSATPTNGSNGSATPTNGSNGSSTPANGSINGSIASIASNGACSTNGNGINKEKDNKDSTAGHLLTRQALTTYETANHIVHYKYSAYSGTCHDLPKLNPPDILKEEIYEIDADPDRCDEQMSRSQADVTKQGYLLKGPDSTSDRMFAHIGSKSFKRRYCYLRQEVDGTYILELHKDEKQGDAKTTIVMDFCTEVVQNPKKARYCFELRMTAGHKSFSLAAEDENDMEDWLKKLSTILQHNKVEEVKRSASLERAPPPSPSTAMFGTLKGLDQSMNPQLMKYGRETDISIAQARRESRRRIFGNFQNPFLRTPEVSVEPYKEQFGQRILIKCDNLRFRLQAPVDETENLCQMEPYITSLALFDAKSGRKITENFHFDLNKEHVRGMRMGSTCNPSCSPKTPTHGNHVNGNGTPKNSKGQRNGHVELPKEWLMYPKQAIVSVTTPHPDIFLVVRIDKILQGGINQSSEAYLKATKDPKMASKTHKTIRQYAQKVGHYRMPFAWTACPLFKLYSSELNTELEFPAIFRQENLKLKDEELLKILAEFRKPEKMNKLTVIPGWLKINAQPLSEQPKNCVTTSLSPLKPFPMPPVEEPTLEIVEFPGTSERDIFPFSSFVNHLFVYPIALAFEHQKMFSRARNLAVLIELRDSDAEDAKPIECIYGRSGQPQLVSQISCPVLHHNTNPSFYEEVKLRLPLKINQNHHLLFSLVHVSCDIKKKESTEKLDTPVGFAWLPLLTKGKMSVEEQGLSVAAALAPGYLSIKPFGLGKGESGPKLTWIDEQRPLLTVKFRIDSTVLTTDQHLHNLFAHAERLLEVGRLSMPSDSETCKILKAAHAVHISALITFLPTILDELFVLLVSASSEEIGLNIIRLLINFIHMVAEEAGRKELLLAYVKYVFKTPKSAKRTSTLSPSQQHTVHGELCRHLPTLLHPNNTDFLLVNKFMKFSGIFFDIIVKSMAHHLLGSGRIKMHRNERFPKEFELRIDALFEVLMPYLIQRHKDLPVETQQLNKSLSLFVKRCLTLMDRGFVFRLICLYMNKWSPGDQRTLQEFKFHFIQEICLHEHFIQLNLPFLLSPNPRAPDILQQFYLSDDFCQQHFLVGLLLQEVKGALNEVGNIRKMALTIFRDLLAKHDLDDRYQSKGQQARIAMLYVPWLGIVLENIGRISDGQENRKHDSIGTNHISSSSSYVFARDNTPNASRMSSQVATPTSTLNSTSTPKNKRLTLHIEHFSPLRASMHLKDINYFAAIAGQSGLKNGENGASSTSLNSDCSTLSQDTTVVVRNHDEQTQHLLQQQQNFSHNRSVSVTQTPIIPRTDKFSVQETKDMLICYLFAIKHLSQEHILTFFHNCTESETVSFFHVLDLCLVYFRYVGKKYILQEDQAKEFRGRSNKSSTLPARIAIGSDLLNGSGVHETGTLNHTTTRENLLEETSRMQKALQESNLATEVGLIVLDCIGLYSIQFRDSMLESLVLPKIARVYLRFLQLGQSETLFKHVFAALRAFINNFSQAIFKGNAMLCGQLVYELLKCCDSRLATVRQESCAVLYLLMRSNFEFTGRKGLTRVHLQVIISVSQMIGNVIGLNNARFQESLSLINCYAKNDKAMKGTGFEMEVKDLTKRVRTVLMATAQMQAHHTEPEKLLELQLSLANSYASTPELRHTWLVTMARNHEQNGNISEAACCHLHIAALMAEYLKLKGSELINWGAESFVTISRNVPRDEKGLKLDSGTQDSQYTTQLLLDQLRECADFLDRSERLECLADLYRLIIKILEHRRDYPALIQCYDHLSQSYNRVIEFHRNGRRLLGRFYRVVFYGQIFFEEEHGVEYIYKEPKVTSLSEIAERLSKQYKDKFGQELVKLIMDSNPVVQSDLDSKIAYIQVTHVTPHFCKDELETRQTEFEQNHDIDTFMFETPFTKNGSARGCVEDQWKRRTILTSQYNFPYVLKRIPVKDRQIISLSPIEVAIDEMQNKLSELADVVLAQEIDVKRLQLRLQGSVAVTVNAGPLAYANAFLDPKTCDKYDSEKVEELKEVFRDFVKICYTALQVNGRVICSDQREYHSALKESFQNLCTALSELLGETLISLDESNNAHRNSLALFSAISGAPNNSSTA